MADYNNKILVVDDDPKVSEAIVQILSASPTLEVLSRGAALFSESRPDVGPDPEKRGYELTLAQNGDRAIKLVEKARVENSRFAAAFIDMQMPGRDGAETARRILQIDTHINIVIITAFSKYSLDDIVRKVGRENIFYLRKPFNTGEIRQFARALTGQWNLEREKEALALELKTANRQLLKYSEDLGTINEELRTANTALTEAREKEIQVAGRIQETLLLGEPPRDMRGLQIARMTIASQKVDGDFYDFYEMSDTTLDAVVGDVMGKGVPSALVGAGVKRYILRAINSCLIAGEPGQAPRPADIIAAVHAEIIDQLESLETFVTLCYARFDLVKNTCKLVDCGHTRTIHFHYDACDCSLLQGENMPLGFPETEPFQEITASFKPGDLFFFYSDGVTEARDEQGTLFGEDRLLDYIQKNGKTAPRDLLDNLRDRVFNFSKSDAFEDDFTCVAIQIAPEPAAFRGIAAQCIDIESDLSNLARIRAFAGDYCKKIPLTLLSQSRAEQFVLAVNEAVVNSIKHAYQSQPGKSVQVTIEASAAQLAVHVYDWGRAFDPAAVPEPEFDGSREGGFGLYIIAQTVDELNYSRSAGAKNCAELIVKLKGGN